MAGGLLVAFAVAGGAGADPGSDGHLTARPRSPKSGALSPGLTRLGLGGERDGVHTIPEGLARSAIAWMKGGPGTKR
ncbi:MAG: hypothetical protein ABI647_00515 [Gemmatimonadota bacterium]